LRVSKIDTEIRIIECDTQVHNICIGNRLASGKKHDAIVTRNSVCPDGQLRSWFTSISHWLMSPFDYYGNIPLVLASALRRDNATRVSP
jgi:hypothetical protein